MSRIRVRLVKDADDSARVRDRVAVGLWLVGLGLALVAACGERFLCEVRLTASIWWAPEAWFVRPIHVEIEGSHTFLDLVRASAGWQAVAAWFALVATSFWVFRRRPDSVGRWPGVVGASLCATSVLALVRLHPRVGTGCLEGSWHFLVAAALFLAGSFLSAPRRTPERPASIPQRPTRHGRACPSSPVPRRRIRPRKAVTPWTPPVRTESLRSRQETRESVARRSAVALALVCAAPIATPALSLTDRYRWGWWRSPFLPYASIEQDAVWGVIMTSVLVLVAWYFVWRRTRLSSGRGVGVACSAVTALVTVALTATTDSDIGSWDGHVLKFLPISGLLLFAGFLVAPRPCDPDAIDDLTVRRMLRRHRSAS